VIADLSLGAQVEDVHASLRDLLDDPVLLIADAVGRAALRRHHHLRTGACSGGNHLNQARVVERVALEADALLRPLTKSAQSCAQSASAAESRTSKPLP
jgi:hypothetical protein